MRAMGRKAGAEPAEHGRFERRGGAAAGGPDPLDFL